MCHIHAYGLKTIFYITTQADAGIVGQMSTDELGKELFRHSRVEKNNILAQTKWEKF